MKTALPFLFLLFHFSTFAQNIVKYDSLSGENGFIPGHWELVGARVDSLPGSKAILENTEKINFPMSVWLRTSVIFDSSCADKSASFLITQSGASEIFIDEKLVQTNGKVSDDAAGEQRYLPRGIPFAFNFVPGRRYFIMVHYSNHSDPSDQLPGFVLRLKEANSTFSSFFIRTASIASICVALGMMFLSLGFVHLLIFFFYKKNRSNLYYSLFTFVFALYPFSILVTNYSTHPRISWFFGSLLILLFPMIFVTLLSLVYSIFYKSMPARFRWQLITGLVLAIYVYADGPASSILLYLFVAYASVEVIIQVVIAVKQRKKGAKIIGAGVLLFVAFVVLSLLLIISMVIIGGGHISITNGTVGVVLLVFIFLSIDSIPLSMSIFLARDVAGTHRELEQKLEEVEDLSRRSIEQEKEKQRILASQNEMLEQQVSERTQEITEQKKVIEEKNKDITDSINYAKRIQDAILPAREIKHKLFPEAFVLFKPKDIVSGDFYWFAGKDDARLIAACDCTGHGVPGALMSMIGNNILNQLVNERGLTTPAIILEHLHLEIRKALKQESQTSTDGMDIALLSFRGNTVEFAGAQRPLYLVSKGDLREVKGDKYAIGGSQTEEKRIFSNNIIHLEKGDCCYIFSDGYADQFGGGSGKKFMTRKLRETLVAIAEKPMSAQEDYLDQTIEKWRGESAQVDDILVIGVRV